MIKLDLEKEFCQLVSILKYAQLKSYRDIIPYLVDKINYDKFCGDKKPLKYLNILRTLGENIKKNIKLGKFELIYEYYYYLDEIVLKMCRNNKIFSQVISSLENDVHRLEELANYFNFLSKGGLESFESEITFSFDESIKLNLQGTEKFELVLEK